MSCYARADFAGGMRAYTAHDYALALEQLKPEATAGNRIAQNIVGVIYMNALGVPGDYVEAMKWFRLAADQGYAVAQTNVGFLYESGRGVERDPSEARRWYEKAAAQGDARAKGFLKVIERKAFSETIVVPPKAGPSAVESACCIAGRDRKAKIEKVAGWYATMAQNPEANFRETTDRLAMQFTLQLGEGATDWGPSNANWTRIHDRVSADIAADMELVLAGHGHDLENIATARFADALSVEDIDALTAFANSVEGKRYWQLSAEVDKLFVETVSLASTGKFATPKEPPSQEEYMAWEKVLKASNGARVALAMKGTAGGAGKDASGSAGIGLLWGMAFAAHREELRRLAATYADDLAGFDAFNESPLGKRQIEALAASTEAIAPKMAQIGHEFETRVKAHQPSWKRLYRQLQNIVREQGDKAGPPGRFCYYSAAKPAIAAGGSSGFSAQTVEALRCHVGRQSTPTAFL